MNNFSYWRKGAGYALESVKNRKGYLARYHSFEENWSIITNVTPIHKGFKLSDNPDKYKEILTDSTVNYIRQHTDDIWCYLVNYKNNHH
tara:strand:+ start:192 stop:458 length:267 start_codon:yes stop_codon:yes gene_type:complete